MSKEIKDFFKGIKLQDGEEFSHESMAELSNNKEEDDSETYSNADLKSAAKLRNFSVMSFTNSPLVDYTRLSPNYTPGRYYNEKTWNIDTITIHCVVGQCSVETLGAIFAPTSRQASSNYGIGYDGRIGMYVEEHNRSWCTSSSANDVRAVTIEVASDTTHPYAVRSAAYKSLIKLVADICKRNEIKKLIWKADKSLIGQPAKQNMTAHRWFASKACPGDYLYNRFGDIAKQVNAILNGAAVSDDTNGEVEIVSPVLKFGSYGTYTLKLQKRLLELKYDLGKYGADSSFGQATRAAVIQFQKNNGLDPDGIVGEKTWAALENKDAVPYKEEKARPVLKALDTGEDVVILQKALLKAGYSLGSDGADGKFGAKTRNAVIMFQARMGLYIDGIVGEKTWEKLEPYITE